VRLESLLRFLFVFYCLEAGLFLAVTPWTPTWERLFALLGDGALPIWTADVWGRGLVTGFGLVHLVWASHDLDLFLRRAPRS
jgi:hypothetical protein